MADPDARIGFGFTMNNMQASLVSAGVPPTLLIDAFHQALEADDRPPADIDQSRLQYDAENLPLGLATTRLEHAHTKPSASRDCSDSRARAKYVQKSIA